MARWRLTTQHYLNVPGTKWEYEETNRDTGKRFRKQFDVPTLISPDDPEYQDRNGDVIVAYEATAQRGDVIFTGPPTPDMEPIDEEASTLTAQWLPNWQHPIESLPAQGGEFTQSLLSSLERQLGEAMKNFTPPTINTSVAGIDPTEFKAMQDQLAQLMARNAELEAAPARRV